MNKLASLFVILAVMLLATPVMAQPAAVVAPAPLIDFSNYFGIGLVVIGAAFGIGKLASSAYEGMSRQPEVAGNIQTAMIIAAALIEGFTFYALFLCTPR